MLDSWVAGRAELNQRVTRGRLLEVDCREGNRTEIVFDSLCPDKTPENQSVLDVGGKKFELGLLWPAISTGLFHYWPKTTESPKTTFKTSFSGVFLLHK